MLQILYILHIKSAVLSYIILEKYLNLAERYMHFNEKYMHDG